MAGETSETQLATARAFRTSEAPGPAPCNPEPDRLRPVREWRIHLGAHKTATTHVQEVLTLHRKKLVARGIDFLPNDHVRQSGFALALKSNPMLTRVPVLRERHMARLIAERLDPLRAGPERVILSEENLIGGLQSVYSTPIYSGAAVAISRLRWLSGEARLAFFLSIRSFHRQIPSCYAQALRFAPPPPGGFDAIKQRILSAPPTWTSLVRRIRRLAPTVPLVVWKQEDYRENTEEILGVLCDQPVSPVPPMEDPAWTRCPSAEAVRAAETLPSDLPVQDRRAIVAELYEQGGDERPFSPFSHEEAQRLRTEYEADIAQLDQVNSIRLLKFG